MSKFTAIGQLIDTNNTEELVEYLNELNYGHLCNVKKMLEGEYQRVETTKDALGTKVLDDKTPEDEKKQAKALIEQLYIALQRIEDRCTLVEQLKLEKASKH